MPTPEAWPWLGAVNAAGILVYGVIAYAMTGGQFWPGWGALATALVVVFGMAGFAMGSMFKADYLDAQRRKEKEKETQ